MKQVTAKNDDFGSYLLENGETRACIMARRGGLIQSFVCSGREIFYCNMATVEDWGRELRGGVQTLFPACGRLKEGPYNSMQKHGFARNLAWEKIEESCDGEVRLTIAIHDTEETRALFPYRFALSHEHILREKSLTVRQTVTNQGENEMPFSLGLHPYFNIDPACATASVPSNLYEGLDGEKEFDGKFAFSNAYDSVCKYLIGDRAVLDTGLGYRVQVSWKAPYKYCVVWSPDGVKFACLEPWTAPPNALNTGVDIITLAPGASTVCEMEISVAEA